VTAAAYDLDAFDPGALDPLHDDNTLDGEAVTRPSMRSRLLTVSDLSGLQPVRPLIDGLLYRDTLAQLSGPPGQYKSFLAIAMACAVAHGGTFEGHVVPEAGPVIYVAAEGATGARARILAWCELSNVEPASLDGQLYVLPEPIQLGATADITEAADMAAAVGALLLILDTRARCTLGLEENSATEQGRAIQNAEAIQRASGATVLAVHHSGRGGDHGRGSTAWDGAVWSDLRMSGAELHAKLTCAKHKDVPDGCDHHFRLVPHTVSAERMPDADHEARSTLVIVQEGGWTPTPPDGKNARIVQQLLWTAAPPDGFTPAQLRDLAVEGGASRSGAYQAINALLTSGFIRDIGTGTRPRYRPAYPQPAPGEGPR
jgi:hypothetical protein